VEPYVLGAVFEEVGQLFSQMSFGDLLLFMLAEELLVFCDNLQITLFVDDIGQLVHHLLRVELGL